MPSTAAIPAHQANKVAPTTAPRQPSRWVSREASIQSAVNRTTASVAKAAAAQRIQLIEASSESHLRGSTARLPPKPMQDEPACSPQV
jgi:hypothetical protein